MKGVKRKFMKKVTLEAKKENGFINYTVVTDNGMRIPVKLTFYNRKLDYKLYCFVNDIKK